jgi:hypothetical protein
MNTDATLAGDIPFDPLKWRVITSGVDANHTTMFTVFGNDAAIQHARSNATPDYPNGSVIALALWSQQEHRRWVGGRVPAQPVSVEFVEIGTLINGKRSSVYRAYNGVPLTAAMTPQSHAENRTAYILSLRAAVMP